ncbi:hypothetical protein CQ056_10895, partial [Peribacillus simplex]
SIGNIGCMISSSSNPNGYHLYMMKFFCSAWFSMNFSIVMDAVGLLVLEKPPAAWIENKSVSFKGEYF